MEWVRENWVSILILIVFIAIHLFGHGLHGGHEGRSKEGEEHKGHSMESSPDGDEHKGGH